MSTRKLSILFVLMAALALQACAAPADVAGLVATGIAGTQQASGLLTEAAAANQPTPTHTPEAAAPSPEPTAEPTATSTASASVPSGAVVTVSQNTNCRSGPGTQYTWRGMFRAGQQTEVLKVYSGGDYAVVVDPSGEGECWLWLAYASPTSFESYNLPQATKPPVPVVFTPGPTATPVYIWVGDWNVRVEELGSGVIRTGSITFGRSGEVITGSVLLTPGGILYELAGSMMPGHAKVAGDFEQGGQTGGWAATMNSSLTQFSGNINGIMALCGWRTGSPPPSSCYAP